MGQNDFSRKICDSSSFPREIGFVEMVKEWCLSHSKGAEAKGKMGNKGWFPLPVVVPQSTHPIQVDATEQQLHLCYPTKHPAIIHPY